MKGILSDMQLSSAQTLPEVLTLLSASDRPRLLAGGTDLMVLFESGKLPSGSYLSLHRVRELHGIDVEKDHIDIKALATFGEIRRHELLQKEFPLLTKAAGEIGAWAIQERATIAGNIVNASPAADSPAALLCYDAQVALTSAAGTRWLPYHQFHLDYKKMQLRPDELLSCIRLPRVQTPQIIHQLFHKVGTRRYQAISKVCFAGRLILQDNNIIQARLAWGALAPVVKRTMLCEQMITGKRLSDLTIPFLQQIREQLQKEIAPIDDIRSSAHYRRTVAGNLLMHFLGSIRH